MHAIAKTLLISLMAVLSMDALADEVNYIDRMFDYQTSSIKNFAKTCTDCSPLPSSDGGWVNLSNGWYYVRGNVEITTLYITGDDVNLILCDKSGLTCSGGVKLEGNTRLTIYNESAETVEEGMGKLYAHNIDYSNAAGIGCAGNCEMGGNPAGMGTLVIIGGNIDVEGAENAAGIGGGKNRGIQGKVEIYGGIVKAKGGNYAAGIGGGEYGDQYGSVSIFSGEVYATGGNGAAGIGGGCSDGEDNPSNGAKIDIYGGLVKAVGGVFGAGIGGGGGNRYGGFCEEVNIRGGEVEATGGTGAAGIGGGIRRCLLHTYEINISGGTVKATGGDSGAGIGTGYDSSLDEYLNYITSINIYGGANVHAQGGYKGAGIGGGYDSHGIKVDISDESVVVEAIGGTEAAAIGIGSNNNNKRYSKDVIYHSGTLILRGNDNYAVGGRDSGNKLDWKVNLDEMKMTFGSDEASAQPVLRFGGDKETPLKTKHSGNFYIKIERCYHNEKDYWRVNDSWHHLVCIHCVYDYPLTEHFYEAGRCPCGQAESIILENTANNAYILDSRYHQTLNVTLKGHKFYKDGAWNTAFLPFSTLPVGVLEGATMMEFDASSYDAETRTLKLSFKEVSSITAGVPCLVRWGKPGDGSTAVVTDPTFRDVFIDAREPVYPVPTEYVDFIGCFSPANIYTRDRSHLFLGGDNKLYYPTSNPFTINDFLGYFRLKGVVAGYIENEPQAVNVVMSMGDETDGIVSIEAQDIVMGKKGQTLLDTWYTIDGRRIIGQPTQKGIYIRNGKKYVVPSSAEQAD